MSAKYIILIFIILSIGNCYAIKCYQCKPNMEAEKRMNCDNAADKGQKDTPCNETSLFVSSPGLERERSQGLGARLDQVVDCELCGDNGCFLGTRNPENCGHIGCGIDDNTHHQCLAPGTFQVRNPENNGAWVETPLLVRG